MFLSRQYFQISINFSLISHSKRTSNVRLIKGKVHPPERVRNMVTKNIRKFRFQVEREQIHARSMRIVMKVDKLKIRFASVKGCMDGVVTNCINISCTMSYNVVRSSFQQFSTANVVCKRKLTQEIS